MAEQIKFEMDSDEAFDILKDIGEAENELGKQCWKDGYTEGRPSVAG